MVDLTTSNTVFKYGYPIPGETLTNRRLGESIQDEKAQYFKIMSCKVELKELGMFSWELGEQAQRTITTNVY